MNWTSFLNRLKLEHKITEYDDEESRMLICLLGLNKSVYDFTSNHTSASLADCFYYAVLVADIFHLMIADETRDVYGDVAYRFVNHDRLKKNFAEIAKEVIRAFDNGEAINIATIQPPFYGLTTALVDCAFAGGWSPKYIMEVYFD